MLVDVTMGCSSGKRDNEDDYKAESSDHGNGECSDKNNIGGGTMKEQ